MSYSNKLFSIPPLILCIITIIYFTYLEALIIKYIVILLNKTLSVGSTKNKKNESLYFSFTYSFSNALPFFREISVSDLHNCPLWRTFFNISCKAGLLATNPLKICLSEQVFISPLPLKDYLAGYRIPAWWFFFSQHFKYFTSFSSCLDGF